MQLVRRFHAVGSPWCSAAISYDSALFKFQISRSADKVSLERFPTD